LKISDLGIFILMAHSVNAATMKERTKHFALAAIRLCRSLPRSSEASIISRQLMRSATSVGANYRAVCRARSMADFVSKLGIVLEEADESLFWIELLVDSGITAEKTRTLKAEADELVAIFVAPLRIVKSNLKSAI
jgi:four helix bundle protein